MERSTDVPERWLPALGLEGRYEVSDQGRVRSLPRLVRGKGCSLHPLEGRILKPYVNKRTRHVTVTLGGGNIRKTLAHLVLETFVGPRPVGFWCRYLNGQLTDCRLENLCWAPTRPYERARPQSGSRIGAVIGLTLFLSTIAAPPAHARQSATLNVTVRVVDGQEQTKTLGLQRTLRCTETSPGAYQCEPVPLRSPGRCHRTPYTWVIEGDIRGCFDHIDHHLLMERLRSRVADRKMTRLVLQFLKAGVLSEEQFIRTEAGTPQGGIVSPLLANIALSAVEERYERWTCHRTKTQARRSSDGITAARRTRDSDRRSGKLVFFPIRYADDFVILVSGTREAAEAEKAALAVHLQRTTGLELSPEKTKITKLSKGFEFLGHRVRLKWHRCFGYRPHIEIPKTKTADLRYKVKRLTGQATLQGSLDQLFQKLNPILRGWANFYRHCIGAKRVFSSLDWYTSDRVWRWRHRKYPKMPRGDVAKARLPSRRRPGWRVWQTPSQELYVMSWTAVTRYRRGWMRTPAFAMVSGGVAPVRPDRRRVGAP